jgi:hypothetical protein
MVPGKVVAFITIRDALLARAVEYGAWLTAASGDILSLSEIFALSFISSFARYIGQLKQSKPHGDVIC